jgi:hypothetical protein
MASKASTRFAADELRRDSDHVGFLRHKRFRWLWVSLAVCAIAIAGYALADVRPRHNGGSWLGYTLGTLGALLIVWLALLGIRKRRMSEGNWSLKAWTSAHVYLGLSLLVVGTLHTGFQLGWNIHTLAYVLMLLVIASGIYGIAVYAALPRAIAANREQMTKAQMLEALAALDRQLEAAAQPLGRAESDLVIAALEQDVLRAGLVARLTNAYPGCRTAAALKGLVLAGGGDAGEKVVGLLRRRSGQVAQIRRHMRLRALLDIWLYVHVPMTLALIAALTAHIISVFYYW